MNQFEFGGSSTPVAYHIIGDIGGIVSRSAAKASGHLAGFNLAGEPLDNSLDGEGEARVRALAESEARKAQLTFEQIEHEHDLDGQTKQ